MKAFILFPYVFLSGIGINFRHREALNVDQNSKLQIDRKNMKNLT
jgi:hypothetical protein